MAWRLNYIEIPKPDNFDISYVEIADYARDISGRLYKTVVAKLRKFTIKYNGLTIEDISKLESAAYDTNFMPFTFVYNGIESTVFITVTQATFKRLDTPQELYSANLTLEEVLE